MQGFLSCLLTFLVTFLSQAIILHTVGPDSRAHQHLSQKGSRLKTQSGCRFSNQLFIRGDQSHAKKRSREVCIRRKKNPSSFQDEWVTITTFHGHPVFAGVDLRDLVAVPSFANLFSISIPSSKNQYLWPQALSTYPLLSCLWFHYECL